MVSTNSNFCSEGFAKLLRRNVFSKPLASKISVIRIVLLLALFPQAVIAQRKSGGLVRVPLEKAVIALKSPKKYERRIIGQDPQTGQPRYYDPKPHVVVLDAQTKRYGLRWIGYDGKEKTIIYQSPDAVDVVVSASVSRVAGGQFLYVYDVLSLPSSMEYISIFAVQNYSSNVTTIKNSQLYIGAITKNAREFKLGNWIGFSVLSHDITRGGVLGMKGVGEEPPQELENVLPGYEIWPHGYTVGPNDQLKTFTRHERMNYISRLLPQMREIGWLTRTVSRSYETYLSSDNLNGLVQRANEDFKRGIITSELHDMIMSIP